MNGKFRNPPSSRLTWTFQLALGCGGNHLLPICWHRSKGAGAIQLQIPLALQRRLLKNGILALSSPKDHQLLPCQACLFHHLLRAFGKLSIGGSWRWLIYVKATKGKREGVIAFNQF